MRDCYSILIAGDFLADNIDWDSCVVDIAVMLSSRHYLFVRRGATTSMNDGKICITAYTRNLNKPRKTTVFSKNLSVVSIGQYATVTTRPLDVINSGGIYLTSMAINSYKTEYYSFLIFTNI